MRFESCCLLAALSLASAPQKVFDFSAEAVGAEPKSMTPVVGAWMVAQDGENKVLMVDGSRWKEGQPAANIADKARALRRPLCGIPGQREVLCVLPVCCS